MSTEQSIAVSTLRRVDPDSGHGRQMSELLGVEWSVRAVREPIDAGEVFRSMYAGCGQYRSDMRRRTDKDYRARRQGETRAHKGEA